MKERKNRSIKFERKKESWGLITKQRNKGSVNLKSVDTQDGRAALGEGALGGKRLGTTVLKNGAETHPRVLDE